MGFVVWDASTDNDGNTAANWTPARVPEAGDVMQFDSGETNDNCTFSGAITCDGMAFANAYTGTVAFSGQAMTFGTDGLICTNGGSATVDCGASTIECSGVWDVEDIGTLDDGTSLLKLTGTGNIYGGTKFHYDVEIHGTYTIPNPERFWFANSLTVKTGGELIVTSTNSLALYCSPGSIIVEGGGTLSGAGVVAPYAATISNFGTWSVTTTNLRRASTINAGIYGGTWLCECDNGTRILTFGGNVTFTGAVTYDADVAANTYTIDFGGNTVDHQGDVSYLASGGGATLAAINLGTVQYTGGSDQTIVNTAGLGSIGHLIIDKTAFDDKVTLANNIECEDFTDTTGTFDIDGNNLDCNGVFIQAAGQIVQDTATGGLITIATSLAINGADGNECVWNGPDVDLEMDDSTVTWTTVTDSDASAGFEIDATGGTNTDGTGNTKWDFGAVAGAAGPLVNAFKNSPLQGLVA